MESIAGAIQLLQMVGDKVGYGSASRETIAEALGYRTLNGTSRRKLAALSHYALLTRSGGTYRISDLGKQILMPRDDVEYKNAIATAAQQPAFYQTLIGRFEGHTLPTMLANILVREYGIVPRTSEEVARTFRESMEFAGLQRHGILTTERLPNSSGPSDSTLLIQSPTDNPSSTPVTKTDIGKDLLDGTNQTLRRQQYTIALDERGTLATVDLPIPLTRRDLTRIRAWVEYMLGVVNDQDGSCANSNDVHQ